MQDDNDLHEISRGEWLLTMAATGLTIALLCLVGYYTPSLVALAIR